MGQQALTPLATNPPYGANQKAPPTPDILGVVRNSGGGQNMDNFIALHELNHFQNYHTIDLDMSQIQVLQNKAGFKNAMGLEAKKAPLASVMPDQSPKKADASSNTKDGTHVITTKLTNLMK